MTQAIRGGCLRLSRYRRLVGASHVRSGGSCSRRRVRGRIARGVLVANARHGSSGGGTRAARSRSRARRHSYPREGWCRRISSGASRDVKISVSGGGSATGITQVAAKAIDIGDSDILRRPSGARRSSRRRGRVRGRHEPERRRENLTPRNCGTCSRVPSRTGNRSAVPIRRSSSSIVRARPVRAPCSQRRDGRRADRRLRAGRGRDGDGGVGREADTGAVSYVAFSGANGADLIVAVDGVAPTTRRSRPVSIRSGRTSTCSRSVARRARSPRSSGSCKAGTTCFGRTSSSPSRR